MKRIESELNYTREMLVALALLLGCDYDQKGINGVGKENACKFLDEFIHRQSTMSIFDLLRSWTRSDYKEDPKNKFENRLRRLVLESGVEFPNETIINEYLDFPKTTRVLLSSSRYLSINKTRPNLQSMQVSVRLFKKKKRFSSTHLSYFHSFKQKQKRSSTKQFRTGRTSTRPKKWCH